MGRHSLPSKTARAMNRARKTKSGGTNGGRPRKKGPRCPCGSQPLSRVKARGRSPEHDPSCPFYRMGTIIV